MGAGCRRGQRWWGRVKSGWFGLNYHRLVKRESCCWSLRLPARPPFPARAVTFGELCGTGRLDGKPYSSLDLATAVGFTSAYAGSSDLSVWTPDWRTRLF